MEKPEDRFPGGGEWQKTRADFLVAQKEATRAPRRPHAFEAWVKENAAAFR